MLQYGSTWLEASIGESIKKICTDGVVIETDPEKNAKGIKDVEQNVKVLVDWCTKIWNSIWAVREDCPS